MATRRASCKEVNNLMHILEPWDPKYILATIWAITQNYGLGAWS
jgi:hypothetical protein